MQADPGRLLGQIEPGSAVIIEVDGEPIEARAGETIAAALLAQGIRVLRRTRRASRPRGLFCGIGVCFDCMVTVDGRSGVRACVTPVRTGMTVRRPGPTGDEAGSDA